MAVGQKILAKYHLPILCITDGPGNAYLFESMSSEKCRVTRYTIPPLQDTIKDVDLLSSSKSPNSVASSLPEATGEAFLARVSSIGANLATMGLQSSQLLLNPLGAGDTCSAIFLLEYLDTKVLFFSYNSLLLECRNCISAWLGCCISELLDD